MSKELEALLDLKEKHYRGYLTDDEYIEQIGEILSRYVSDYNNSKPSEALEGSLKRIKLGIRSGIFYSLNDRENFINNKDFNTIEEALLKAQEQKKVLDIIREKEVNVAQFQLWLRESYITTYNRYKDDSDQEGWYIHLEDNKNILMQLTQEEFDTLRRYFG